MNKNIAGDPFFTCNNARYKGLRIGEYTYGTPLLFFWDRDSCSIGKFCSISAGVKIFGGGEHNTDWVTTYPFSANELAHLFPSATGIPGHPASKGPTVIGNDVWIGNNACIMSGVRIGHGAAIGAESVVTKDVPPYAIVGGNPAKIIRMRFQPGQIESLLKIRWWDWHIEKIESFIPYMLNRDIDGFISRAISMNNAADNGQIHMDQKRLLVIGKEISSENIRGFDQADWQDVSQIDMGRLSELAEISDESVDAIYVEINPRSNMPKPDVFFETTAKVIRNAGYMLMKFEPMPPEAARKLIAATAQSAGFKGIAMLPASGGAMFALLLKTSCTADEMRAILSRHMDLSAVNQQAATKKNATPAKSFVHPWHWGPRDLDVFNDLLKMASKQVASVHCADNLFTINRCNSFLDDDQFMKAWEDNCIEVTDKAIIWRRYLLALTAFHCVHFDGDFVEAGTYRGTATKTIIDYLGPMVAGKTFWLYDLFEHPDNALNHAMPAHGPGLYESVLKRFENYPNVKIFRGFIPDVFREGSPEKICWLHIDLNQAPAEMSTLESLFDRVVPGGIVILDDYECLAYKSQKDAQDPWFARRGYRVLPIPTGQGLILKR